jgi:hypothetical protein
MLQWVYLRKVVLFMLENMHDIQLDLTNDEDELLD